MRGFRHVQGVLRSASPLVEAFNMSVMDEMFTQYTGHQQRVCGPSFPPFDPQVVRRVAGSRKV